MAVQVPNTSPDSIAWKLGQLLIAFGTGVLGAVVAFKIWLNGIDSRLKEHDGKFEDQAKTEADRKQTAYADSLREEREFAKQMQAIRLDIERRHEDNRAEWRRNKQQQVIMLEALANIASAVGVDKRFSDTLLRLIAAAASEDT